MLRFIALLLFAALFASPLHAQECNYYGKDSAAPLKRGINLSSWWQEAPPAAPKPHELKMLRTMGFDFARLPISQQWLDKDPEEQVRILRDIRCSVVSILNSGMAVVVDLHSATVLKKQVLFGTQDDIAAKLSRYWQILGQAIKGLPPGKVILSVYNEPELDMPLWWPAQEQVIKSIRASFPYNPIVASANHGGWDLVYVKPYADKNVLYDFHFYEPLALTHYGATWFWGAGSQGNQRGVYPNPDEPMWNRAGLAAALVPILGWKNENNARLICLEIGIYRPYLDTPSRAKWLKDSHELLEASHVPWALWEYRGSFGLIDVLDHIDPAIAQALALKHSNVQ